MLARITLTLLIMTTALVADGTGSPRPASRSPDDLGVLDGIVRSVEAKGMFVEVHYRSGGTALRWFDFGPHMRFNAAGHASFTSADLVAGAAIGMVVQRQRYGPMRVVTVWLD